jgi:ribonuclease HIII
LFTTEKSFYQYSKNLNITWPKDIILQTKADSHFMTVALASIIARALFLIEMDKLNKKYNMIFPLGAGNVIPTAKKFVKQYSKDELSTFCKTTFKTFNEI